MNKPTLIVTHERSGTHLLINIINFNKKGQFNTIGHIPENTVPYTVENYKHQVYKDIVVYSYNQENVCKSHHQVEFVEPYIDFIFDKYKVIYLKRDIRDVLLSYYNFLTMKNNIEFEKWIFEKPDNIGKKFLLPYSPDPHVLIEPVNYIKRWKIHIDGWLKYKDNLLILNYEDILNDFNIEKEKIENYINKKISNNLPDKNDLNFPNFRPGKGIIGEYKNWMDEDIINKIQKELIN